jgi:hypothetical protein
MLVLKAESSGSIQASSERSSFTVGERFLEGICWHETRLYSKSGLFDQVVVPEVIKLKFRKKPQFMYYKDGNEFNKRN